MAVVAVACGNSTKSSTSTTDAPSGSVTSALNPSEKVPVNVVLKGSSAAEVSTDSIDSGSTLTTRIVFMVGADQKFKSLKLVGAKYPWTIDLTK